MSDSWTCRTCDDSVENIIELIEHECDQILLAEELTRQEQSTLLYLESRLVDQRGKLDHEQMNYEDQQSLKLFRAAGLLDVEGVEHITEFTDKAWDLAAECRRLRAHRGLNTDREINIGTIPGENADV